MPTFLQNGRHVPNEHAEGFARSLGVVQGQNDPDETPAEAWARTEQAGLWVLKRGYIQMRKRELEAANVAAEAETILTDI